MRSKEWVDLIGSELDIADPKDQVKKEIEKGKANDFKKECSDDPPKVRRYHTPRLCRKHIIHL